MCLWSSSQHLALERWYRRSYMCPGVNKPVSLATSSYVTEDRAERWWQCRFMAPSNHTCQGNSPIRQLRRPRTNRLCLYGLQLPWLYSIFTLCADLEKYQLAHTHCCFCPEWKLKKKKHIRPFTSTIKAHTDTCENPNNETRVDIVKFGAAHHRIYINM